jgi:hypothetical protein
MKLYPILFEAAKTSEEALDADLAIYVDKGRSSTTVILFSQNRTLDLIDSYLEKYKGTMKAPPSDWGGWDAATRIDGDKTTDEPAPVSSDSAPWSIKESGGDNKDAKIDWLIQKIGNRVVVGAVGATGAVGGIYRVFGSAAVQKYGPMIYEMVMATIYPSYLRSDYSLSSDSRTVWNKMYLRKDVEREWIGSFEDSIQELETSFGVAGMKSEVAQDFASDLAGGRWRNGINKNLFDKELVAKLPPEDLAKLGPFYAYRLKPSATKLVDYTKLHRLGEDLIEQLAGTFKLPVREIQKILAEAAREQFQRLYQGQ